MRKRKLTGNRMLEGLQRKARPRQRQRITNPYLEGYTNGLRDGWADAHAEYSMLLTRRRA